MLGLFSGITVLEIADFIAGPYCARLLADLGARVIKVEPPRGGDSARNYGPFPDDVPHRERSGLFLLHKHQQGKHYPGPVAPPRTGSYSLAWPPAPTCWWRTPHPAPCGSLAWTSRPSHATSPSLVYVSITPYGQDGPKAPWAARHINTFHASGEGYTLPGGSGYATFPQRGPVTAGGHLGEYDAGLQAAIAAVAALYAREVLGSGAARRYFQAGVGPGPEPAVAGPVPGPRPAGGPLAHLRVRRHLIPGRDGYVILYPREDQHWQALAAIMEQPELVQDDRFRTRANRIQNGAEVNGILAAWGGHPGQGGHLLPGGPQRVPLGLLRHGGRGHGIPPIGGAGLLPGNRAPQGRQAAPSFAALPAVQQPRPAPASPRQCWASHNEQVFYQELG